MLSKIRTSSPVMLFARFLVAASLLWMGLQKVQDPVAFLKVLHAYHLLPDAMPWLLNAVAALLPWVEIFLGFVILFGIGLRGAAMWSFAMLCVFTFAVAIRSMRLYQHGDVRFCAIHFDCGCGSGDEYVCPKIAQNVLLIALSALLMLSEYSGYCLRHAIWPVNQDAD